MTQTGRAFAIVLLFTSTLRAQTPPDVGGNDTGPDLDRPVAVWHFNGEAEPGIPKNAKFEPGPRPPAYSAFPADNTALPFTGKSANITVREKDLPDASLRFTNGDSITLEAW